MAVPTPRLGLVRPEGTDLISRVSQLNESMTKIDTAVGIHYCTSTTRPSGVDAYAGKLIRETDTGYTYRRNPANTGWTWVGGGNFESIGSGSVRAIRPLRPLGTDVLHSAFPAILYKQDGEIICTYRQGTDHITARDGILRITRSPDMGRTWSTPTTLLSLAGIDLRDSGLAESADGTKIWLTYCKCTAAAPFNGAFMRTSTDGGVTFSNEVRIDNGVTAACVAPIVELNDGTLLMPWYGTAGAETWRSAWVAKSTDGGATWTSTRIANGQTAGRHYEEPYIARKGTTLGMTFRWGAIDSIGFSSSVDNGVNWATGASEFPGTGKPQLFWVNKETLAVIYRQRFNQSAVIRYTRDLGVSWFPEKEIQVKLGINGWMAYSDTSRIQSGVHIMALAQETTSTFSRIYFSYVGEAGVSTPFGVLPQEDVATAQNIDNIIFATNFDQPDGALAFPWSQVSGTTVVANGIMAPTVAGTQHVARVFAATAEYEVEAECFWNGAGATGYGGIVFAMTDASNYWAFLRDVSAGVEVLRLYQWAAGAPTMKATLNANYEPNTYHRMTVNKKHGSVRCFWNGTQVLTYKMTAGELSSTVNGLYAGMTLQYSAGDSTTTWCRRFVIRR